MIGQDSYGVQRRALDVEDYIDVARRHKGWIFGPTFAALVASVVGAFMWPDTYISSSTIKVLPQQVPTNYVEANVNQRMTDRITSLANTILSRQVLTALINTHQLYPKQLARKPMDDVVEEMRKDIGISAVQALNRLNPGAGSDRTIPAFQISFSYTDRYKAQRVVQELTSRFIEENLRNRSSASLMTSQFLKENWEDAKRKLEDAETKLGEFRARNQGRLPDQMQGSMQQITAMQARLNSLNDSMNRINQEKMMMEGLLRIYKDELTASSSTQPVSQRAMARKNERVAELDREIQRMEDTLAGLRERYRDTHPDVQQTVALIAAAKKKREAALKEDESKPAEVAEAVRPSSSEVKEARALEQNSRRIETQIAAKNMEADDIRKEMASLNASMKGAEARLQGAPLSEKEYSDLIRQRDLWREKFFELDAKVSKSDLAQKMETQGVGEALEVLDTASLPATPAKPNRLMAIGIGACVGLGLGVFLAGAREVKDTSLKNLKDVRAYTQMPVLGSIPLLENDLVIKRRRRLAWLGWSLACLAGIAVMSGSVIYYYATRV